MDDGLSVADAFGGHVNVQFKAVFSFAMTINGQDPCMGG